MRRGFRPRPEANEMLPLLNALRWPVYLLWWSYVSLLALSPLPALAQEMLLADGDGLLTNGCHWDNVSFELDCSNLGLKRVPYVHPNISAVIRQLNLVSNSLETLTIEDVKNFTVVTLLDLRSNQIRVIDDEVFSARYLPQLQQLFLGNNSLRRLPENVFKHTVFTTLDLSYNSFEHPPSALGNTTQIETLLLNNNPFRELKKDSLANISFLATLELSKCNLSIDNIDPMVFSDLMSLRALYLDQNYFPNVTQRLFSHISSVRDLYMQQCGIQRFERRAFSPLNSVTGLHLTQNNITELYPNRFRDFFMETLDLRDCGIQNIRKGAFRTRITNRLYLSGNNITVIHAQDFKELQAVKHIYISHSGVSEIRGTPFLQLQDLEELHIEYNNLEDEDLENGALNTTGKLVRLDLTGNKLTSIPNLNGRNFTYLQQLDIGENNISSIGKDQLRNMTSLSVLVLSHNPIKDIHKDAFLECEHVTDLNLDFIKIKRLPDMRNMAILTDLHMVHGSLEYFPEDFCTTNARLIIIEATANSIFKLTNFSRCRNLFSLALDHNKISEIPEGVFNGLTKLNILKLHENHISDIAPGVFKDMRILQTLTLYHNDIRELPQGLFSPLTALRLLNIGFNNIQSLPSGTFASNTLLIKLWLNNNNIQNVHPTAFAQMQHLQVLNMSSNYFCSLEFPGGGFPSLRVLGLEQLWCLHNVPSPHQMPNAQEVYYTYAYHCCLWEDFLDTDVYSNDTVQPTTAPPSATEEVTLPPIVIPIDPNIDPFEKNCNNEGGSDSSSTLLEIARLYNLTVTWGPGCTFTVDAPPQSLGLTPEDMKNLQNGQPTKVLDDRIIIGTENEGFFEDVNVFRHHYVRTRLPTQWQEIKCFPRPNPLTPCDNLLDPWPIRVTIWAVWVVTLLGNIAVLFIMIAARQKMDVSQFFICVLAFSNTLLGVYLAFIAMVDIRTLGERSFYQSALQWQKGSGCQTAGFLAIFSSQLSVYILVILTIERLHHVVTSATDPYPKESKKLRFAVILIIVGIIYACILAVLPLNGMGVNAYDEVAICLPFVSKTPEDRNYILAILSLNMLGIFIVVVAFVVVFGYLFQPSLSSKKRQDILTSAIKLSLLMITTFLCWFPIGIVGYSSILDEPMINAEQAKYFIVFVFPVNALFSPIIYALITRTFRKNIWWIVTCCPNRKSKDSAPQTFRLIQRQATSTPTSLMSSDMPRGQSPRSLTGEELRVLRQSRRSNSYSVQFNPNFSNQQQCATPPTPGSITRMGRRASLPAVFGSNIAERGSYGNGSGNGVGVQPIANAFPFRLAPGLLSQLNSSLPNLPEENESEETETMSETQLNDEEVSSRELPTMRKLSTVPEGDEAETEADCAALRGSAEHRLYHISCDQQDGFRDDASIASNESAEYVDAHDFREVTPTKISIQCANQSTDTTPHTSLYSPTSPRVPEPPSVLTRSTTQGTQLQLTLVPAPYEIAGISSQESNTVISTDVCTCSSVVDSYCPTCNSQGFTYHPLSPSYSHSPSPAPALLQHRLSSTGEDTGRLGVSSQPKVNHKLSSSHIMQSLENAEAVHSPSQGVSFTYSKLQEQLSPPYSTCSSGRLEIVNPKFTAHSPTQRSETDV